MATKTATSKPRTASTKASAQTATLAQAAAQGSVRFYRQRRNKTMRNLPYLASGTKERGSGN